jgi:uncharacterized membrane protein
MDAFTFLIFLPVALYLVLQALVPERVSVEKRWLAFLPLPFMILVFGFTAYALLTESNLWPLIMIFTSPVACLVLLLILGLNPRRA